MIYIVAAELKTRDGLNTDKLTARELILLPQNQEEASLIERFGPHLGSEFFRLVHGDLNEPLRPGRIENFTRALETTVERGRITQGQAWGIMMEAMDRRMQLMMTRR